MGVLKLEESWYRVSLPYATFALIARENKIIDAAPIAGWALGKQLDYVLKYYRSKGARVDRI